MPKLPRISGEEAVLMTAGLDRAIESRCVFIVHATTGIIFIASRGGVCRCVTAKGESGSV